MPTIGIYVPIKVSRAISSRWQIYSSEGDLQEVIRGLCAQALEDAAGVQHADGAFSNNCVNKRLHKAGHRCRVCAGS
jgi:hypothetical protein